MLNYFVKIMKLAKETNPRTQLIKYIFAGEKNHELAPLPIKILIRNSHENLDHCNPFLYLEHPLQVPNYTRKLTTKDLFYFRQEKENKKTTKLITSKTLVEPKAKGCYFFFLSFTAVFLSVSSLPNNNFFFFLFGPRHVTQALSVKDGHYGNYLNIPYFIY